ncbi:MAG: hypothetical protein JWP61_1255 [Friedmanniella sp.]|nr:hypothetical protein [Friedmanniella sp.]
MSSRPRTRRLVLAAVAAVVVLAAVVAFAVTRGGSHDTTVGPTPAASTPAAVVTPGSTPVPSAEPTPKPARVTDPLTGRKLSRHPVIAVKVENIAPARPQVGLSQADIVFTEEVEGAQTRLIALYHTTFPRAVEPVRSARSTDVQLLPLFGRPGLVYSGANPRVQAKIDRASIVPLYRETRDPRRVAPHNVRVDLAGVAAATRLEPASSIGWTFAAAAPIVDRASKVARVSSRVGHDTFAFDRSHGRYTVRWNGRPYVDGDSGATTRVDNVIVMRVHNHGDGNRDVLGSASVQSDTVGSGRVSVYRDGHRLTGTWSRGKPSAPLRLRTAGGQDIPLAPGQTWVTLQG